MDGGASGYWNSLAFLSDSDRNGWVIQESPTRS